MFRGGRSGGAICLNRDIHGQDLVNPRSHAKGREEYLFVRGGSGEHQGRIGFSGRSRSRINCFLFPQFAVRTDGNGPRARRGMAPGLYICSYTDMLIHDLMQLLVFSFQPRALSFSDRQAAVFRICDSDI